MSIGLWKHFKKTFVIYIGIGIIVSFLKAMNVFYFQKLLNGFGTNVNGNNLLIYGLTIIIVPILAYMEQRPSTKLQKGIFFYLKKMALVKMSKIAYPTYLEIGSGALLQKVEAGATAGRNIHLNFYGRLFRELLPETCFNLFFIAIIDVTFIPAILIGYILVFLVTKYLLKILRTIKERALVSEEGMNNLFIRGITEMVTFRMNKRYQKEIQTYDEMATEMTTDVIKMTMIHEFFFGFFAFLVAIIKLVIVVLAFTQTITLSLGGIVALVTYVDRIYTPIAIFNVIFIQYHLDKVAYQRLHEFYDTSNDTGLMIHPIPMQKIKTIHINHLTVTLKNKKLLKDVTLELVDNKIYGLVGESGVGKSTLVKTILGLFKPAEGEILINHKKLSDYCLNDYYDHIFYISQEVSIFQGTLKENIVFDQNVSNDKVIDVIKKCQLNSFYQSLENGLDTQIGEKGSNISGGEKQRIAFARMFFSEAEVIVMDEATAALDEQTEKNLLFEVEKLFKDKLVIMITHRPENLAFVDEIIEMKKQV